MGPVVSNDHRRAVVFEHCLDEVELVGLVLGDQDLASAQWHVELLEFIS